MMDASADLNTTNLAQAVRIAFHDHEVIKFIGRDCRTLEKFYEILVRALIPAKRNYTDALQQKIETIRTEQGRAYDVQSDFQAQLMSLIATEEEVDCEGLTEKVSAARQALTEDVQNFN